MGKPAILQATVGGNSLNKRPVSIIPLHLLVLAAAIVTGCSGSTSPQLPQTSAGSSQRNVAANAGCSEEIDAVSVDVNVDADVFGAEGDTPSDVNSCANDSAATVQRKKAAATTQSFTITMFPPGDAPFEVTDNSCTSFLSTSIEGNVVTESVKSGLPETISKCFLTVTSPATKTSHTFGLRFDAEPGADAPETIEFLPHVVSLNVGQELLGATSTAQISQQNETNPFTLLPKVECTNPNISTSIHPSLSGNTLTVKTDALTVSLLQEEDCAVDVSADNSQYGIVTDEFVIRFPAEL
jgi:hypothetical protein